MAQINFGGVKENVVTREEFPLAKALEVLKNETIAVIGYGVQGPGQALNPAKPCSTSKKPPVEERSYNIYYRMQVRSPYGRLFKNT